MYWSCKVKVRDSCFLKEIYYGLDETRMLACEPIDTPIKQNHRLGESPNDTPVDRKRYRRLVGKLICLAHTHLDIAYAVSMVNQFMHAPCKEKNFVLQRILKYLKSALGQVLFFLNMAI